VERVLAYLKDVKAELRKVSWPTRQQVWVSTLVVIFFSLALSLYLGILDALFTALFGALLG